MPFHIADAVFWIAVACCLIAQVAIVRSVVASPTRPTESSPADSSGGRRTAEIAWAVLPGLALIVLFFFTWRAIHPIVIPIAGGVVQ